MPFRNKTYDRLEALSLRWGMSRDDIYYAIENGLLRACVWMPLRCVEFGLLKQGKFIFVKQETKEGFMSLRPQDFRMICGKGSAKLRIFRSLEACEHIIRLTYEPPQPSLWVRIHDVVVLQIDQAAFEERYQLNTIAVPPKRPRTDIHFLHSPDYRYIEFSQIHFRLGDVQAKIVEHLHSAAYSSQPWVHGKTLIDISGSNATRMRDIFKHKKNWRRLIASDDRGYYRLNIGSEPSQNEPAEVSQKCQQHEHQHQNPTDHSENDAPPSGTAAPIKSVILSIQFILVFITHQMPRFISFSNAMSEVWEASGIA